MRYLWQGTVLTGFQQALQTVLLAFVAFTCKNRRNSSIEADEEHDACAKVVVFEPPLAHDLEHASADSNDDVPLRYLAENLERQLDSTRFCILQ